MCLSPRRVGIAALVLATLATMLPAHGQQPFPPFPQQPPKKPPEERRDPGPEACSSARLLVDDLRNRTLPTAVTRQRLTAIFALARGSDALQLREIAGSQAREIPAADDARLLAMAEQFRTACVPR
jgi:hypothetical protein